MGKLTMALTYLTAIALGVVLAYFAFLGGGGLMVIVGAFVLVLYGAYLIWADFFRRNRVKT
jgi:O-antigen/teichoic acid export membrane protein